MMTDRRGFEIGDLVELRHPLSVDYTGCTDDEEKTPEIVEFSIDVGERGVITSDPMCFRPGVVQKQAVRFIDAPNWPNLYWSDDDGLERSIGPGHYVECRNLRLVSAAPPDFFTPDLDGLF